MKISWFAIFWIVLVILITTLGSYYAYTGARMRVEELGQTMDIANTDFGMVVRLALGLEDVNEEVSEEALAPDFTETEVSAEQDFDFTPTTIPTIEGSNEGLATLALTLAPTVQPEETQVATAEASAPETTGTEMVEVTESDVADEYTPLDDPRRVTILLLGIDQRTGEEGQFRTDTIIVLSIDPVLKTGAMLSIPRDLWIELPGGLGNGRINTANFVGDNPELNYPGGGPALAMRTVEQLLGVPIHHYVLINFDSFITLVNSIGAVEVCPPEAIHDTKYPDGSYGTKEVHFEPGCQELEAERLLEYARTRASSGGDFDRSKRQQEVIMGIRQKVLSLGGVRALIGDAFTLWESVSNNVRTDMTLDEMIRLALTAGEVSDIRQGTIGTGEVLEGIGDDGSQVLVPIQTDILDLVSELFSPRPASEVAAVPPTQIPEATLTPVLPTETAIPTQAAATAVAQVASETPLPTATFTVTPSPTQADTASSGATADTGEIPADVLAESPVIGFLNGSGIEGQARLLSEEFTTTGLQIGAVENYETQDITATFVIYYGDHLDSAMYVAELLMQFGISEFPRVESRSFSREGGNVFVVIGTDLEIPATP